jgi:hypothetical protein
MIKLGKLKLFVSNIITCELSNEEKNIFDKKILNNNMHLKINHKYFNQQNLLDGNPQCRICYIEMSEEDPLLSVCNCIGSVKYIHFSCLQSWVISRSTVKQKDDLLTTIKCRLYCELCKTPLPSKYLRKFKKFILGKFNFIFDKFYFFKKKFS